MHLALKKATPCPLMHSINALINQSALFLCVSLMDASFVHPFCKFFCFVIGLGILSFGTQMHYVCLPDHRYEQSRCIVPMIFDDRLVLCVQAIVLC